MKLLAALLVTASAFTVVPQLPRRQLAVFSETDEVLPPPTPPPPTSVNRLGSSIDQDGKSNIWAVEPKMRVEEVEAAGGQTAAVALGAVLAFALIASSFLFINVEQ